MFVNLTQMYLPFYLQETLKLPNSYVATIPLIIYVAGFATSTVMKYVNGKIGRKATFIAGCALGENIKETVYQNFTGYYQQVWQAASGYFLVPKMTTTTEISKSMGLLFSWALVDQPCLSQGKYALSQW